MWPTDVFWSLHHNLTEGIVLKIVSCHAQSHQLQVESSAHLPHLAACSGLLEFGFLG